NKSFPDRPHNRKVPGKTRFLKQLDTRRKRKSKQHPSFWIKSKKKPSHCEGPWDFCWFVEMNCK
ncbi:hypothetical protein, partial [uncultured Parasutterella sp.]|uniref:hypothetical protein n=1 Tax=uncultured Parasutterella sp. TaxID=1263098 RepID=UPI002596858C